MQEGLGSFGKRYHALETTVQRAHEVPIREDARPATRSSQPERYNGQVAIIRPNPEVYAVALALAEGDVGRLRIDESGITVLNNSRFRR